MTDSRAQQGSLEQGLLARGRALAAAAGALVTLLALCFDVPVSFAIGRGAVAFVALSVVVAIAGRALAAGAQRNDR